MFQTYKTSGLYFLSIRGKKIPKNPIRKNFDLYG